MLNFLFIWNPSMPVGVHLFFFSFVFFFGGEKLGLDIEGHLSAGANGRVLLYTTLSYGLNKIINNGMEVKIIVYRFTMN